MAVRYFGRVVVRLARLGDLSFNLKRPPNEIEFEFWQWPKFALAPTQPNGHIGLMGHIDYCLDALQRLIAKGDANDLPLAEEAIQQYWAATLVRARKSGLLYIQQILHGNRDTLTG